MAKVITFFNHKGGVGKTTLIHNLSFALADAGQKVLLIDSDQQMNLTAAMYGLSTSMEYSTDEDSRWEEYRSQYISLLEHLNIDLKNSNKGNKVLFKSNLNSSVHLLSGDINLSEYEADLYGIIKNDNAFNKDIPHKFEKSIKKYSKEYDFILIDTAPSAGSIINALLLMSSDYFIAPVSPSFFSLQAIDNLSTIFKSWSEMLAKYQTVPGFQGVSMNVKFLGLVVQLAKRYKGGGKKYTSQSEDWIKEVNISVNRFHKFALTRGQSITEEQFKNIFIGATPFIIEKCCDFTPQLRSIAEKEGVPVIYLTQDICRKHNKKVDITMEKGQYKMSLDSIKESYHNIAENLIKLKNIT
jgi:chromosome partitioning protein